jgi:hypothetical protein
MNKSKLECKIYLDSEQVSWIIPKESIEKTLLDKKKGLLYLNVESAGEIEFNDDSCKVSKNSEKICDKKINNNLKFKNGKKDSVYTPLSVVNFHTHPLTCYIEAETIWGWPSGEDLSQCLNFASDNNLVHIIFAVEGTYIIDVNKLLINFLKTDKKLYKIVNDNIEEIFKLTHKHRMIFNDSNKKVSLEKEFNEIFLKPLGLTEQSNILYSWLNLVNNLTLEKLIKLSNNLSNYFKDIKIIRYNDYNSNYLNMKIFQLSIVKNKTEQWNFNLNKKEIFNLIKNKRLNIELPDNIIYKSHFISSSCKL